MYTYHPHALHAIDVRHTNHVRTTSNITQPVHAPGDQHIRHVPLTSLSKLSPYSALTLSIVLVILFLLKQFVIDAFLIRRLYGDKYTRLNDWQRRSFVNHHIAGATKFLILIVAVYPFINVAFRYAVLNDPYARGSRVTMGDILVVCTQMLVGMYIFELIYRVRISVISSMHHIGAIMVAQAAIAISLDLSREKDASIEFILCTVWGAFDIVCELLPHIAMILYRIYPTRHLFLSRLFLFAACTTFFGTLAETLVVFYLFGSLWDQWQRAFQVVTPVLHVAFSATQVHGSRILWSMHKSQVGLLVGEGGGVEGGGEGGGEGLVAEMGKPENSVATLAVDEREGVVGHTTTVTPSSETPLKA